MADESRPSDSAEALAQTTPPENEDLGAPIARDAVDPELLRLSPAPTRRHPGVALAVLAVCALLVYRLGNDIGYALLSDVPKPLPSARAALAQGHLDASVGQFVSLSGLPDHRNALAYDPKGGRSRMEVFRVLGTDSRMFVTTQLGIESTPKNGWTGRLRRMSDLSFAGTLRSRWEATTVLRALDLSKLSALPAGGIAAPFSTLDRAGQAITLGSTQEILIDVRFPEDVRVLLGKDKFPSEPDARHEVERLGFSHGPGLETGTGFGYVLRVPATGPERTRLIAQVESMGVWFWQRIETYRVPLGALQVSAAGLVLPGPDALPQPVRYGLPSTAAAPTEPGKAVTPVVELSALREPTTVLPWGQIQSAQISEPLHISDNALVLSDGETPASQRWTLAVAGLLGLCALFNLWYLRRSLQKSAAVPHTAQKT